VKSSVDIRSSGLRSVETLLGLGNADDVGSFVRFGRWHLAARLLSDDTGGDLARLRSLSLELERGLAKSGTLGRDHPTEQLPFACAALYAGNNPRGFYPSRALSVKIQGSRRDSGDIRNDVRARTLARQMSFRNMPEILYSGAVEGRPFLADEFVAGRRPRPSDGGILVGRLIPDMFGLYRNCGFSLVEPSSVIDIESTVEAIARFPIPDTMVLEQTCRDEVLRRLRAACRIMDRPLLAVSGHGDISNGNIVLTEQGDYRLLDWKHARRLPAAWDFRKLLAMLPGVQAALVPLIGAALRDIGATDAMPAEDQCLLAACARLIERGKNDWSAQGSTHRRWIEELRQVAIFVCLCR
jgi:hypothetical protein